MRSDYVITCFLILVAIGVGALAVAAETDPYDVFVTWPTSDYGINDTAEMTVWTMNKGLPEDPAEVNLTVGDPSRFVTLTRQGNGVYKAVFTMLASDLDENGRLHARARAKFVNSTSGSEYEKGDSGSFITSLCDAFQVDLIVPGVDDEHVNIGQTINLQVRTSFNGKAVDADFGSVRFSYKINQSAINHVGLGLYECTWDVPSYTWYNESNGLLFDVSANYTVAGWTASDYDQRMVLLNHFRIWFHEVSVTATGAVVEVYVLDRNGTVVDGANVTLEYSEGPWDSVDRVRGTLYGVTDSTGKVEFTVDYSELNESRCGMYFLGEVVHGGKSQNFDEHIYVRDPPTVPEEPPGPPYTLLDDEPLPPGTTVSLSQQFTDMGTPMTGTEVLLYIVGQRGVLFNGLLVTNDTGWIIVEIRTPDLEPGETYVLIEITRVIWLGDSWSGVHVRQRVVGERLGGDFWDRHLDESTTLNVSMASTGGTVMVTLDHPDADGLQEKVGVAWGLGLLPRQYVEVATPWRWTRLHCCNWNPYDPLCWVSVVECTWTGVAYEGIIEIPGFIEDIQPMWFYGTIQFLDSPVEDLRGVYLENVTPPVVGDGPPRISIELPIEASTCWGGLVASGTAWDDFTVRAVDVRLDGGEWTRPVGKFAWTYAIDTTALVWGVHVLEARSFDGFYYSEIVRVTFRVDNPPARPTADLVGDVWLMGIVPVNGTAPDDGGIIRIEVRIDRGDWVSAEGASLWLYLLDTTGLRRGEHTFSARSFDGTHWSETFELPFLSDNPPTIDRFYIIIYPEVPTTVEFHGTASDDGGVELVEYRVGDGDWTPASGTRDWHAYIDTIACGHGEVTVYLRAFDGLHYSEVRSSILVIDNPPELTSVDLAVGVRLEGIIEVHGTAWDDDELVRVEVSVDHGPWATADGTTSWLYVMDTGPLLRGPHTLSVRAYDGSHWSPLVVMDFIVDRSPRVSIRTPSSGAICSGLVTVNGTAWDDGDLEMVELRIDDGPWLLVEGTSSWRFELDTTGLAPGAHRLTVRAFDGELRSPPAEVSFKVDQPPSITVISPSGTGRYSGMLTMSGTASDDIELVLVEWCLDGGSWHIAYGTSTWTDSIDCSQLAVGMHTVEVRCFDGVSRSSSGRFEFEVIRDERPPGTSPGSLWPWAMLLVAIVAVALAIATVMQRRSRF